MEETWRYVPGFEGKYQISIATKEGKCRSLNWEGSKGRVKELTNKPKICGKHKRIFWGLRKSGKRIFWQAARWIALTYPELVQNEYFEGAEIDHINTDSMDNRPCNLRWVDRTGQMNNPATLKNISKAQKGKKVTEATRKKLSKVGKGRKHTEESKKKMSKNNLNHPSRSLPVVQYTLNWEYVNDYPSAAEAGRILKCSSTVILNCCNNKPSCHTAKGYRWKFKS